MSASDAGRFAPVSRAWTLALLAAVLAISALPLMLAPDAAMTLWWVDCFWLLVVTVTAARCLRTTRQLEGRERKAWLCFSAACLAYLASLVIWAVHELILNNLAPVPSAADFGALATPLLLMAGIWRYRMHDSTPGATFVEIGNFGIIVSAIFIANSIWLFDVITTTEVPRLGIVVFFYCLFSSLGFFFILLNILLHLRGRKRGVMSLILLGMGALAMGDLLSMQGVIEGTYQSTAPINLSYLAAFVFIYWAASEQDRLRGNDATAPLDEEPEARASQLQPLLPPMTIAGVLIVAVMFQERLRAELLPHVAVGIALFIVALALRDWWGRRIETRLREQTLATTAQLQQSEERLLEKNRELADANRELWDEMRARMRVQEELRQSQKMEALGHLTGGVAHDFNNLLAVIMGNLELLAQRLDVGSQEYAMANEATGAAERGAALTQRLLAFSRKQKLTPRPIDLGSLLEGMWGMLESTLSEAIQLEIHAQEDLWHCMADSAQLENALLNLVINARDAMGIGGRLRLEASNITLDEHQAAAYPDARAGSYVSIAVRDSGAGIPVDVLPRVFDPFFTTKEVGAGSGLGLSMVYGFASQSGGFVSLESEVGLGTEVRIYLPRAGEARAAVDDEDLDAVPRGNGESVLLVEDEPTVRKLLVCILEDLGYAVTPAEDGAEALAILHEGDPVDAIVCDVVLPGVYSGPELIREIARRRPGVRTLLMSGYASEVLERSETPLEDVELLQKPFKKAALARALRVVLDAP